MDKTQKQMRNDERFDEMLLEENKKAPMHIGIIGCGITGGALKQWFEDHAPERKLAIYDPAKPEYNDPKAVKDCDWVFICVPVPNNQAEVTAITSPIQDLSILEEAIGLTNQTARVFIRSTILPGTTDELRLKFRRNSIYAMPEFLTERRAYHDMESLPLMVGLENAGEIQGRFRELFGWKQTYFATNKECEMAKYVHNAFAAIKVNYFNIIHEICKKLSCDYDYVAKLANITGFIGEEHTKVPGPDGAPGYGGKCLPKDTEAFSKLVSNIAPLSADVLLATIENNTRYRNMAD